MEKEDISRRRFLVRSLAGVSASWLLAKLPEIEAAQDHVHKAMQSNAPLKLEFFTPEQAAEVEAISSRIIPTDDTPGAREAGVVYFIDRALMTFDKEQQPLYIKGLKQIDARCRMMGFGKASFASLKPEQQDKLLKRIEKGKFFQAVRTHTVMGFLCDPSRGGNRDQTGWKVLGFEDQFYYKPPFGYYDAEAK
jgi:gluconate 2-dehydrogenase gamma chain